MPQSLAKPTTRDWLNLARAGNFPSVASNVLAALVLASNPPVDGWPLGGPLVIAVIAGCLIYAGGATLNDAIDAKFDATHRPERPIPRGIVTSTGATTVAALEMGGGVALLLAIGASPTWAVALVLTILLYDLLHKRWSGSVILMAGCRVLLALTVASLPRHAPNLVFWIWIGVLFVYIVTLSLLARREYKADAPAAKLGRIVGWLLAAIPLIDALALVVVGAHGPAIACALAVPAGLLAQRLFAAD